MNRSNDTNQQESYHHMIQALQPLTAEGQALRHVSETIRRLNEKDVMDIVDDARKDRAYLRVRRDIGDVLKQHGVVRRMYAPRETDAKRLPLRSPVTVADRSQLSPCGSQSQIGDDSTPPVSPKF